MSKLQKIAPAWHDEAKKLLVENFEKINAAFLDSTKRAVWLGLFLLNIKQRGKEDKSIPHGFFKDWCKANVPEISFTQLNVYMLLARGVCEKGKFEISNFDAFQKNGNRFFVPGELPPPILKLVEGKTQNQLLLDFKQVEEDGDELRVKHGRLKGSSGLTKKMRLDAKFKSEDQRMKALAVNVPQVALWLKRNCNALGFLNLPKDKLTQIREAVTDAHLFFQNLDKQK